MKIKIITNTFGNYHRQNVAVDSWRYLRDNTTGDNSIDILNVQFEDEKDSFENPYPDIKVKHCLTNTLDIIKGATKKLPFVSELFQAGLDEDCDGFIWTNSDVIITKVLINKILNTNPKAIACSRLDIVNVESFQQILEQKVQPVRWEIAGVDACYFRKDWAETNKDWFLKNRYLMGKFLFDCQWGATIKILGDYDQPLENAYPVSCFHIHHGISSVLEDCPERTWNLNIAQNDTMNRMLINSWSFHFSQNIARRTPYGSFLELKPEEKHIENTFFSYMSMHRNLT